MRSALSFRLAFRFSLRIETRMAWNCSRAGVLRMGRSLFWGLMPVAGFSWRRRFSTGCSKAARMSQRWALSLVGPPLSPANHLRTSAGWILPMRHFAPPRAGQVSLIRRTVSFFSVRVRGAILRGSRYSSQRLARVTLPARLSTWVILRRWSGSVRFAVARSRSQGCVGRACHHAGSQRNTSLSLRACKGTRRHG